MTRVPREGGVEEAAGTSGIPSADDGSAGGRGSTSAGGVDPSGGEVPGEGQALAGADAPEAGFNAWSEP